ERAQGAAFHSRQADGDQAALVGGADGAQDIGRVAAGADGDGDIPRVGQGNQRFGKDTFVPVVVGVRREGSNVVAEAGDLKAGHVRAHRVFNEVGSKVRSGAGAAAVAKH